MGMIAVTVEICRYTDDSQPGWVECVLTDAAGRNWLFVEKVPVVSSEPLKANSKYPCQGVIACQIVERQQDDDGRERVVIDTDKPWGVESSSGETRFTVRAEQLVELFLPTG
jgi:hypothetical protein